MIEIFASLIDANSGRVQLEFCSTHTDGASYSVTLEYDEWESLARSLADIQVDIDRGTS